MKKILICMIFAGMVAGCASAPETYTPAATPMAPVSSAVPGIFCYPVKGELFSWPVNGSITSYFGSKVGRVVNKGIDIQAEEGASVRAAKKGKVVFCDSYLKGFGKTVIIDHGNRFQTIYSYNSDILVRAGDVVDQNAVIAKVGRTGRAKEPTLHFEVRRDGVPQNPLCFLKR